MKKLRIVLAVACALTLVACSNVEKRGEEFAEAMANAVLEGDDEKADSIDVALLQYTEKLSEDEDEKFYEAFEKKFDEIMNF